MGMFGLAAFSVQKRRKEISIRKVLGASANSVLSLLSRDFLSLIVIAGVVGIPLSWFLMTKWLDGFAYRISIGPMGYLISVATISLVTTITISLQVFRAATVNPVESLRSE